MIAYYMRSSSVTKPILEVTKVSESPFDVLDEDVVSALKEKFPNVTKVHLAKNVTSNGMNYKNVMQLAHGSTGRLPISKSFRCTNQAAFYCVWAVCMV